MTVSLTLLVFFWGFFFEDFDFDQTPFYANKCPSAPEKPAPLRFIAFGDWGQGTVFQRDLAHQMARQNEITPFQFALLLGDNIYPDGNIKKYANAYFESPYQPLLKAGVGFYPALGNHDTRGGYQQDQITYFKMPGDYYQVSYPNVDFFILNTTYFVRNPVQQAWLKKALSQSRAPWKIVVAHHPLHSSGRNGDTGGLRDLLEPILIQYGVDLYLSGHDHNYERFNPMHGIRYIVSGGGGGYLTQIKSSAHPHSNVRIRTHHFLLFELQGKTLYLKAMNKHGDAIDCTHWTKGS